MNELTRYEAPRLCMVPKLIAFRIWDKYKDTWAKDRVKEINFI